MITSRFTTTETRVVRKWLSVINPSFELSRIMHYIIYVWAEVFLTVKHRNSFLEAPRVLLLGVLLTCRHCSIPEKSLLQASMSTNGQMAHHENILLAMLASSSAAERAEAVDIIMSIREQGPKVWDTVSGVRPFKVRNWCIINLLTDFYRTHF